MARYVPGISFPNVALLHGTVAGQNTDYWAVVHAELHVIEHSLWLNQISDPDVVVASEVVARTINHEELLGN